jgi:hypothetical protein
MTDMKRALPVLTSIIVIAQFLPLALTIVYLTSVSFVLSNVLGLAAGLLIAKWIRLGKGAQLVLALLSAVLVFLSFGLQEDAYFRPATFFWSFVGYGLLGLTTLNLLRVWSGGSSLARTSA